MTITDHGPGRVDGSRVAAVAVEDEHILDPVVDQGLEHVLDQVVEDIRPNRQRSSKVHVVRGYTKPERRQTQGLQSISHPSGDYLGYEGVSPKRTVRPMLLQ